jgi:ABC-type Na+ transport system ATPase subunit NatA
MRPTIAIENLRKEYAHFALKDISLIVAPGRITDLLGRNGAGKSTLIKCALEERTYAGRIVNKGTSTFLTSPAFVSISIGNLMWFSCLLIASGTNGCKGIDQVSFDWRPEATNVKCGRI